MSNKNIELESFLVNHLQSSLITSCQPLDDGPMDKVEHIVAMALATVAGGAKALRIEGIENVRAVAKVSNIPIVGIVKRDLTDTEVRITPFIEDVIGLAEAGATIIAFDGTDRPRPVDRLTLLNTIHEHGCIAMADCADLAGGKFLHDAGCTFIGSTLSGYLDLSTTPNEPDYQLVSDLVSAGIKVIAEGRYNSPERAAKAIELGALCVTVGSAITRLEHITGWFVQSINNAKSDI
ncbi:N-acetylmannosamine-6-phosphate 2-epimerase [uncultured Pseudoalteromonas sp.]|uniref:N-acetylmannosamine-6-phosphate 2-epimerase n=1 Tax=Pseudoalteromonas sp. 5-MNA-CIBAN-0065 TaxID=3140421 RepID=UPI0030D6F55C|tara:strand:+ start:28282 stop:28989 length:708 start_codon:yes stop_codon:yes gene_type:complete